MLLLYFYLELLVCELLLFVGEEARRLHVEEESGLSWETLLVWNPGEQIRELRRSDWQSLAPRARESPMLPTGELNPLPWIGSNSMPLTEFRSASILILRPWKLSWWT